MPSLVPGFDLEHISKTRRSSLMPNSHLFISGIIPRYDRQTSCSSSSARSSSTRTGTTTSTAFVVSAATARWPTSHSPARRTPCCATTATVTSSPPSVWPATRLSCQVKLRLEGVEAVLSVPCEWLFSFLMSPNEISRKEQI